MQNNTIEADAILRRAAFRLVPLILAMYIAAYLNRVNVSFAALTMNQDMGFSAQVFGWGTGVFFLGYLVFEVPANLIMEKVGARLWLSRIIVTWAIISMAFAFVQGPVSFFILRFLLGLAEAGFYPGILLYFTYWFPAATRARILALFCAGIPLSNIVGAPLSGLLLEIEGYGLKGWQWMYILEGIPTLALGFVALWCLPDNPAKAKFLSAREKQIVLARLDQDPKGDVHGFGPMLRDWRVWALIVPDFCIVFGIYALGFWMPQMVKAMGYTNMQTSWIVMIPYVLSLGILWAIGVSSDRTGKRVLHFCIAALTAAAGFAIAALGEGNTAIVVAGFCLASGGVYAGLSTFWTVPPLFLGGTAAAGAFALINCLGNLSGFIGPGLMGWLLQTTGSYQAGLWMCVGVALAAAISMRLLSSSIQRKAE
ncbi:MAG TPA: MFS transporter [Rhizomicrobium sp.]|nr:MFS transporter [Rhizomicrobium sp.]